MNQWTIKRKLSLGIHAGVVLIPFSFSTVSALFFWRGLFASWLLAVPMVLVVDVLALLGLVLFIAGIASPFVWLRHMLPFISIVPLGVELYGALERNGPALAWSATIVATAVLVGVAWKCFETIERLFVPPIEAAREKAREQMERVRVNLAVLEEMQTIADAFAHERMRYHAPTIAARVPEQVEAYPMPAHVQLETTKAYECPGCQASLTLGAYGSAKRYGYCKACKKGA